METSETPAGDSAPRMGKTGLLTYERHYGLTEKPFSLSTHPGLLYRSEAHAPVYDDLLMAIQRREGLVVLTGDIGTGKTTLCRSVLAGLDRKTFTTFVPDPFVTREDLLKMLLVEFGVVSVDDLVRGRLAGASRPDLSYPLYEFLKSLAPIDAFAVLILDEAQHLPAPLLEEIRILSDLEDGRKLLQVVLIGQPELRDALALPHMRQVRQRVSLHRDLQPLTRDGVAGYVAHRLMLAGAERDRVAFTDEGVDRLFAASAGVPRVINLICDRALHHGAARQVARIGPDLVATAVADLRMATSATPASVAAPASAVTVPAAGGRAPVAGRTAFARTEAGRVAPVEPGGTPAADGAVSDDVAALAPEQAADFDRLLSMAPTVVRRGPPPVTPARGRRRTFLGVADGESTGDTPASRSSRVPVMVIVSLTTLGILVGSSLVMYMLWMRPMLRARTVVPRVEGRRSSAPAAAVPVPTPTVPTPLPLDQMPAGPIVQAESAVVPSTPSAVVPPAGADAWAVQVGAFADASRARALREALSAQGFDSLEQASGDGVLTVVLVGPYPSAAAADEAKTRLRQGAGFDRAIVRHLTARH